eukprot:UN32113
MQVMSVLELMEAVPGLGILIYVYIVGDISEELFQASAIASVLSILKTVHTFRKFFASLRRGFRTRLKNLETDKDWVRFQEQFDEELWAMRNEKDFMTGEKSWKLGFTKVNMSTDMWKCLDKVEGMKILDISQSNFPQECISMLHQEEFEGSLEEVYMYECKAGVPSEIDPLPDWLKSINVGKTDFEDIKIP